MLIHSKKIKVFLVVAGAFPILSFTLMAQQPPAPSSGAGSAPSAQPSAAPESSPGAPQPEEHTPPGAASSALDYLFNHKASDGSAAKEVMDANEKAKTDAAAEDALGNKQIEDPEERARFERYLGANEVPQDQLKAYSDDMNNVIDLLHQKRTTEAWQQLYKLAKYESIDAGVSWELANRIESIWNADQTSYHVAQQNDQLQKQADDANRNADMMSDDLKEKEIDYQRQLENANKH